MYHSLALKADGSIVAWGWNDDGQATAPAGNDFIAIAAGKYHSLALKADASIVAWGKNNYGQATAPAGKHFTAIAAGDYYSLALVAYEYWPPIEARVWIFPRVKNILAWIRLPEGIDKEQISDEPILLYPGEIEAVNQYVIEHGRRGHKRTSVLAFFKKAELMDAVVDNGEVEVEAVGSLTSGRYFYGSDTVLIKARRYRPSRRWRFN